MSGLPGRQPARFSQSAKLLALLQDGEWHTTQELLRAVPCIVHTRISELRKRGWTIEHETTGPGASGSRYRLLDAEQSAPSPLPCVEQRGPSPVVPPDGSASQSALPDLPGQLAIEVAA